METFLKDKMLGKLFFLNLFSIIVSLGLIIIKMGNLPLSVPLFYNRPWGNEQLAPKALLFLIPAISTAIFILNFQLVKIFLKKDDGFLALTMSSFSLLCSLLGTITLGKIIFLVS